LTHISLPENVTVIDDGVFEDCSSLTDINIPEHVTKIGCLAFLNCKSLVNLSILKSVTDIGRSAFDGTPWLAALGDFPIVNNILIRYQGKESKVTIPDNVTKINLIAFFDCQFLTDVIIPQGVTFIGAFAFGWCTALNNVTIPASVTQIHNLAFIKCEHFTLHVKERSYAQKYAEENNLNFVVE